MSTTNKRKIGVAEPASKPKRRQSTTATPNKRNRDEEEVIVATDRKKSRGAVEDDEEPEVQEVPVQKKRGRGRPAKVVEEVEEESPVVATSSTKSSTPMKRGDTVQTEYSVDSRRDSLGSEKKVSFSPQPSIRSEPSVQSVGSATKAAQPVLQQPVIAAVEPVAKPVEVRTVGRSSNDSDQLADEAEIVSIWNQVHNAFSVFMGTVSPVFLVTIIGCYVVGKVTASQAVASVGLVYSFLLLLILGSYFVALVPFILASRLLTDIIAPDSSIDSASRQSLNTYCRLTVFLVLIAMSVLGLVLIAK